jgi:UDP-N-acetylmuramoyl-L-alanyl-D-glutamate--2,6-diaminopimelate ligase
MKLSSLLAGLDAHMHGPDVEIGAVTIDSRRAHAGTLFVACPGATPRSQNGHTFVEAALAAGASAIVVSDTRTDLVEIARATFVVAKETRRIAATLAERVAGNPSSELTVIGVTGTNGKTTVTYLVAEALRALGQNAAVLGTLGVGAPDAPRPLGFTTPEAETLSKTLRTLVEEGVQAVAMEVSSHALATARVDGIRFRAAAFTNLTQDHLDFHATMGEYLRAKARLFDELLDAHSPAVLPAREVAVDGERLTHTNGATLTWGVGQGDVQARDVELSTSGIRFTLLCASARAELESPLVGAHNVENLLVAAALLFSLGHPVSDIARALADARGAPGRLERVPAVSGRAPVIVDYAHTPDALARVIEAVRAFTTGRLIVVFGCGGDRDRQKRPRMGAVAARGADIVILTSDNPRSEDPNAILDEIEPGVRDAGMSPLKTDSPGYLRVVDRALAIARAVELARADDVVLLAGKGHETTMTVGTTVLPFDDRVVAARALRGEAA